MTDHTLTYAVADHIGLVRFQRPAAMNSLTETMLAELEGALDLAEADASLRAFVITGQGKGFCVGLDLGLLEKAFDDIAYFESVVRRLAAIIERVEALPVPTIAAVNGYARAGGFELAMGCDFLLIADNARIGDAHTDAGVVPACVSLRLKRRIGEQKAKDLLWTARWLEPQEAVSCGLALKMVPAATLIEEVLAFARTMTDKPTPAIASLKQIFREAGDLPVAQATEYELASFVRYMSTQPYGREGYYAFREKRAPSWRG